MFLPFLSMAQMTWRNVDTLFAPLPRSVHVFYTRDSLDGKPNIAYYLTASLNDKNLLFTVDSTHQRRQTPSQYYEKNKYPLLVVNCTFFEFVHNSNLNLLVKNGKMLAYGMNLLPGEGKDTLLYHHFLGSALGISKRRKADVAWVYADSSLARPVAFEKNPYYKKDSTRTTGRHYFIHSLRQLPPAEKGGDPASGWKMRTAVGGGPVLLQDGEIRITNNEEMKFTGKAIEDKHPRTAMGYTRDGQLMILVIQGRFPGKAEGANLVQEARLLKEIGCLEALNLERGGSSCMLVNGKPTITPSDKEGQRPVPAVFMIQQSGK